MDGIAVVCLQWHLVCLYKISNDDQREQEQKVEIDLQFDGEKWQHVACAQQYSKGDQDDGQGTDKPGKWNIENEIEIYQQGEYWKKEKDQKNIFFCL